MCTPHINAPAGGFAKTVLLPGDPLRAKFIAGQFLQDVQQVNNVRNMLGYTGTWQGKPVSVMGSGMGVPSLSIYAHELYTQYGVENIIRVGSCGALQRHVAVNDIVFALGASTDSGVNRTRSQGLDYAALADFGLLELAVAKARAMQARFHVGNVFTTDLFYSPDPSLTARLERLGLLGAEMEAAGLYGMAQQLGKKALVINTVSDHILTGESLSPEDREKCLNEMVSIALATL